jgi:hypothetical protein
MTKRKHLLYKGLGVSGLCPCPAVVIRVSCFMMILFKGVRVYIQNERNESYLDKKEMKEMKVILIKRKG